jgi:hypothetical protein
MGKMFLNRMSQMACCEGWPKRVEITSKTCPYCCGDATDFEKSAKNSLLKENVLLLSERKIMADQGARRPICVYIQSCKEL